MKPHPRSRSFLACAFALAGLLCLALCVLSVRAEPEESLPQLQEALPPQLTLTHSAAVLDIGLDYRG